MSNTPAMETVRERIRAELPAVFNLYRGEPVIMNKIIDSTIALITDLRADPSHPVRVELDNYLSEFISRLRNSPELASRVETLKHDLLDRPGARRSGRGWVERFARLSGARRAQ
jgi:uncharacterized membrane-anchored protein YjiN (DUF445 family)